MENSKIDEVIEKMTELLVRSEERIDRTNDMMFKCISVINKITEEYTKQIDKLQASRDEILNQNKELINIIKSNENDIEKVNKRYDLLLEKAFGLAQRSQSENNINVK